MKIDKDQIVAEALRLLDERGLDGLTTRALADRLGVKQPALYWHFANRQALLLAMNEAMLAAFLAGDQHPPHTGWQDYVFQTGRAFRAALLAHRDGARVHAGTPANRAQLDRQMQVLVQAGLPIPLAIQLLAAVGRFTVGCVLEEQAEQPALPTATDPPHGLAVQAIRSYFETGDAAAFETGLRFLIAGAAAAMERQASPGAEPPTTGSRPAAGWSRPPR